MLRKLLTAIVTLAFTSVVFALSGTYYIGGTNTGANWFRNFTSADSALNSSGSTGTGVIFNVRPGTYSTTATYPETFPLTLTIATNPPTATTPVVFQKESTTVTISASTSSGTDFPIVYISNGVDYVTYDGIDVTATSTTPLTGYYLNSTNRQNGCQYNTIKNCTITMNRNAANSRAIYILVNANGNITPSGANSHNTILNVTIHNTQVGIEILGDAVSHITPDIVNQVLNCSIGVGTANDIQGGSTGACGIVFHSQSGGIIRGCEIANVTSTSTAPLGDFSEDYDAFGIQATDLLASCFIERNKIHDIKHNGGTGDQRSVVGIYADSAHSSVVRNNLIYGLSHSNTTETQSFNYAGGESEGYGIFGMNLWNANAYNNTILINAPTTVSSTCIVVGAGTDTLRNNICVNTTASQTTAKHYGIVIPTGTTANVDYNLIYVPNGTNNYIGYNLGTDKQTWANWQAVPRDANGKNGDPLFVSTTDLHIQARSGSPVSNVGQTGWVTDDYDGEARSNPPDIGADEGLFAAPLAPPATVTFGTLTTTSIVVNWSSVSGATGYRLEYSTDGSSYTLLSSPVTGTTYTDNTTITYGNTRRWYQVYSINSENTLSTTATSNNTYSLANTPATPTVANPTTNTIQVTPLNSVGFTNTTTTQYMIQIGANYVQADGSLGGSAVWQTLTTWGTITVTGLTQNTTYSVTTQARNGSSTATSSSGAASITTLLPAPSAITFGTPTCTTIVVNWTTVTGATYRLESSTDNITFYLVTTALATNSFSHDTLVKGNTLRYYRVYSINSVGALSSSPSPVNYSYSLANTPTAPETFDIATYSAYITPHNSTNPENRTYTEYALRITNSTDTFYVAANGSHSGTAVWQTLSNWGSPRVTSLSAVTTYYLKTMARDGNNNTTAWSPADTFTTAAEPTTVISFGTITTTSIQVKWTTVPGYTYKVEWSPDDINVNTLVDAYADTQYVDNNFTYGNTKRSYRIYTIDGENHYSSPGPWRHIFTLAQQPAAPSVSNITTTTFQVTIQNSTSPVNTDSTYYSLKVDTSFVQRDGRLGTTPFWETLTSWGTVTVTGLTQNTTYSVSSKAKNGTNDTTNMSSAVSATTLLPAPTAITFGTLTTSSIVVNWSEVTGATYRLEYSDDGLSYNILSTPVATNTYTDNTPPNGNTRRYYRVYSLNSVGALSASPSPANNTHTLANTPSTPTTGSPTTTSFQVTPNNASSPSNTSATEYAVQVGLQYVQATGSGTLGTSAVWASLSSWGTTTVTGLISGTSYTVSTKARNGSNTETGFSSTSPVNTTSDSLTVTGTGLVSDLTINQYNRPILRLTCNTISGTVNLTQLVVDFSQSSVAEASITDVKLFYSTTSYTVWTFTPSGCTQLGSTEFWTNTTNTYSGFTQPFGSAPAYLYVTISTSATAELTDQVVAQILEATSFTFNGTNGVKGEFPISSGTTVLPVELNQFSGSSCNGAAYLHWVTESEYNNAGFDVLRRIAGQEAFLPIATYTNNPVLCSQSSNGNSVIALTYDFTDNTVLQGTTYEYRLRQVDLDGIARVLPLTVNITIAELPREYSLQPNYPNPFNSSTTISFSLPKSGAVTLSVFDITGRNVTTLVKGYRDAGTYRVLFNGRRFASGEYIYRLKADGWGEAKKLTILK